MEEERKFRFGTKDIVRVGIFGALSAIFYLFIKFPLPIFPSFLEFHFDEVPAFIASFAYGPITGLLVLLVKTVIKLPFTKTLCVGELADLLYSIAFILPASLIYKKKRTFKGVIIGLSVGFVCQLVIAVLLNIYLIIPFYLKVMLKDVPDPEAALLGMLKAANPKVSNIRWSYGLMVVLPFNALKNALVIAITLPTYKSVRRLIDKITKEKKTS